MKKIVLAGMLFVASIGAMAVDFGVSGVRDLNTTKGGVRVSASAGEFFNVTPRVSATTISGAYNRFAAGVELNLVKLGPLAFAVTGDGVYQNSSVGASGYGAVAGAKGTFNLDKNLSVVGGLEHFYGQSAVSSSNGNVASLGVNVKF